MAPVGSGGAGPSGAEDIEEEGMASNRGTKLLVAVGVRTRRHCPGTELLLADTGQAEAGFGRC